MSIKNVLHVYDYVVRSITEGMVEKDKNKVSQHSSFFKAHFNKNSELSKQMRIINALSEAPVHSKSIANRMIYGSSVAVGSLNKPNLVKESQALLSDFGNKFPKASSSSDGLRETVNELFTEWCKSHNEKNLLKVAQLEESVRDAMLVKKELTEEKVEADPLVLKLMIEKMNKKWTSRLDPKQAELLKSYLFEENHKKTKEILTEARKDVLEKIDSYVSNKEKSEKWVCSKLKEAKKNILSENLELSDKTISHFMDVLTLINELGTE